MRGGSVNSRQIVVGTGASASYTDASSTVASNVDVAALREALKAFRADLAQANLSDDAVIAAQTSVGQAILEGIKDDRVEAQPLQQHLQQAAATLKESNVAVQEGTALWNSISKLVPLLAPVVAGGARAAAGWFGISI